MTRHAATDLAVAEALGSIARQERRGLAIAAADMVLAETNQNPPRDPDQLAMTVETLDAVAWNLQPGDRVRASMRTDDGLIDFGSQDRPVVAQ